MEPRDGNGGGGEQRPSKKSTRKRAAATEAASPRAPSARKRSPKAVKAEQNGVATAEREAQQQTAYDVKEIHRSLSRFSDDDLKQIPIVPEGEHLEQGGTYVDLAESQPVEVKVNAGVIARAGHYYVPKNRVPYTIWNRLIGEAKPGQEVSGAADRSVASLTEAEQAASLAADLKSWMDAREEDKDRPREVL